MENQIDHFKKELQKIAQRHQQELKGYGKIEDAYSLLNFNQKPQLIKKIELPANIAEEVGNLFNKVFDDNL